ncbi:3-isopropylmalate dehydratase small subunit [Ottowia thiooxydans]|uniref:3-isopropylmalate dehydratase small subunit n=1 Tax=Ottowia thiooxydans TaxID=219182 RepID=UPI0004070950|nr:3-isopropylmalate dehydratase small subunit [Ottowia thiooxydans]
MKPFDRHIGVAAALLKPSIDTDAIIPSREIKTVGKDGLAEGLFANWRYRDVAAREPDPDFVLNRPEQIGTTILLAGPNFGCGSSREHAAWALAEWGVRAVIAPSFGAIFFANCIRNGLLPVVLAEPEIKALADSVAPDPQVNKITLDLTRRELLGPGGVSYAITLGDEERGQLLSGLDPISKTLQEHAAQIDAFEVGDRVNLPWMYS